MPLLNGLEKSEYIDSRLEAFEAIWAEQKRLIEVLRCLFHAEHRFDVLQAVLDEINAGTVDNVTHFLESVSAVEYVESYMQWPCYD